MNVTNGKLAADAVTNAKLADNAVQTDNILNANVTTTKIAPGGNNQVLATNGSGVVSWENKIADGTAANNTMRWNGTAWVETTSLTNDNTNTAVTGELTITGKTTTNGALAVKSTLTDTNDISGAAGQLLASTATGVEWMDAPSGIKEWLMTEAYELGDLVIKDNKLYQANAVITGGAAFVIGTSGLTWKEISETAVTTWVSGTSTAYVPNNLVAYSGIIYKCMLGHTSATATPDTDATNWVNTDSWLATKPFTMPQELWRLHMHSTTMQTFI